AAAPVAVAGAPAYEPAGLLAGEAEVERRPAGRGPDPGREDLAAARAVAAGLIPWGSFEVDVSSLGGFALYSVTSCGLDATRGRAAADRILPLLAGGRAPWEIDQITLRGPRASVVLTPLGSLGAGGPVLAATVAPGAGLALLEIRCRAAAAGHARRHAPVESHPGAGTDDHEEPDLLNVDPS